MTSSRTITLSLLALFVLSGCYLGHQAPRDGGPPAQGDAAILPGDDGGPPDETCGFERGATLFDVVPIAGTASIPRAIDGAGRVYGEMGHDDPAGPRAFRWDPVAGLESLDLVLGLPEGTIVEVAGVGADGAIAGTLEVGPATHAFVWTPEGGLIDLSFEEEPSTAVGLAGDGSVLVNAVDGASLRAERALLPLGVPIGASPRDAVVEALDVAAGGEVVGTFSADPTTDLWRAFRRTTSAGYELLPTPGGTRSRAVAISADGRLAVGSASLPGDDVMRPMLWRDGELVQLPTIDLPGITRGAALDVNVRGVIVGVDSGSGSSELSVGWIRIGIQKLALDWLLATGGWQVRSTRVVTEDLRVLAIARRDGELTDEAVLLTPRCRPDLTGD